MYSYEKENSALEAVEIVKGPSLEDEGEQLLAARCGGGRKSIPLIAEKSLLKVRITVG